jgi:hypothetical protein
MSIRSRTMLALLGILTLAGLEAACFENPNETKTQTNDQYCQQHPSNCSSSPQGQ